MESLLIENLSTVNEKLSPIEKFYHGQSIFITGNTGFLGKLFECRCGFTIIHFMQVFERLKDKQPNFRDQIIAITGDCNYPNLGISSEDRATLIREVSIVFHIASTVKFDEKLKLALTINVGGTKDDLNLCKEIFNLKVFKYI
nr:PREDICTED: putative fatty acyl-CoA reductase CG5065 [Linepithema humile]